MDTAGGENIMAASPAAEARLRLEAQQMRQKPLSYTRGTRDITEFFTSSANLLPSGELVKDEYFTLFEAVGALEVCCSYSDIRDVLPSGSEEVSDILIILEYYLDDQAHSCA